MGLSEGASETVDVRFAFDRRVNWNFMVRRSASNCGLLLFRELEEVLGLHDIVCGLLRDARTGQDRLLKLGGLLRQSVFG